MATKPTYGIITGSVNLNKPGYRKGFSSAIAWLGLAGAAFTVPTTLGTVLSGEVTGVDAGLQPYKRSVNRGTSTAILAGQLGVSYLYYKYLRRPKAPK